MQRATLAQSTDISNICNKLGDTGAAQASNQGRFERRA